MLKSKYGPTRALLSNQRKQNMNLKGSSTYLYAVEVTANSNIFIIDTNNLQLYSTKYSYLALLIFKTDFIWAIEETLTSTSTQSQNGPGNNSNR